MNPDQYKALTDKGPLKKKSRTRPLPKAGEKYLEPIQNIFYAKVALKRLN